MKYLDPKNDLTFKKIFGEHPDILISFLNALMPLEEGCAIEAVDYLPIELTPDTPYGRNSIVDVRCIDNFKRQFVIEMQMFWTSSFMSRVLFNTSKAYVRQAGRGVKFETLKPVYTLGIINDVFRNDTDNFYHLYKIIDTLNSNEQISGMEFVMIELPKFKPETMTDRKMMVMWLRFLTEIKDSAQAVSSDFREVPETKKAVELLEESSFNELEMDAYDRYWDAVSVERSIKSDGKKEGLAEGIEQGIEQGRAEGIEQGKAEGIMQNKLETARQALAMGISKADVAKLVQLPEDEIDGIC